jgi:ASC-1-like (ASCH) protein
MATYESGRESYLLDYIIDGKKTVEGRLNRGKFKDFQVGDLIWLRRDYRDEYGHLQDGEPRQVCVEIVAIRHYQSFADMVASEGYRTVIPNAESEEAAVAVYNTYYTTDQQLEYGVLAIEIALVNNEEQL